MTGSIHDYDKRDVVAAVRAQRERTIALLDGLPPPEWETIVTPGWRVREVAAHLISTDEASLTGRLLATLGTAQRSVEDIEAWNDEQVARWSDRPVPALLHGLELWGRRITRALSAAPSMVATRPIPTPFGTVSLAWLGMLRVYDEWVHDEDLRRTFGLPSDDARDVVSPVVRHLLALIPIQTLPRIEPGTSGSVAIRVRDVDLPSFAVDLGAQRFGDLPDPDAAIDARSAPLVLAAARRLAWRDLEAGGELRIEGEREPAELFLDALLAV